MFSRLLLSITLLITATIGYGQEELRYRTFSVINAANGLADNSAQTLSTTKSGRMIISTIGHINFYDGNAFTHVNSGINDTYKLKDYDGNYHAYFDRDHHFWLKDKHKVSCVNLHTEKFIPNIFKIFQQEGISSTVDDLFTDNDKRLWLVSGGRLWCDKKKYSISINRRAKLQDLDNIGDTLFLFYSDSQIETFNLKTSRPIATAKTLDSKRAAKYNKTTIFLRHGNGYFQLRSGNKISVLSWIDAKSLRSKIIMEENYFLCNLALYNNILYISSSYGYWTINLKNGEKFHRETLTLDNGKELETDINAIDFDNQGGMWIGTEKRGLLYSKPQTPPFIVYNWQTPEASKYWKMMDPIKSTSGKDEKGFDINCVVIDSRGWRWVGQMNGIKVFDRRGKLIKHIVQRDGMLNEVVHSIVEDNYHNMWAGTSNGIVAITIKNGKIDFVNSYNSVDRIPAESFKNGKAMKLADGAIVMQAVDHVIKFNPASFHTLGQKNYSLTAKFVKLLVNGINITPDTQIGGHKILENVASQTKELNLDYNQNFINLTFSGLNYFRPYQTYYRYRVVGLSDKWQTANYYDMDGIVDIHGLLHIPLPGLAPGRYVVEVQASMYPNLWDNKVATVKINVLQPWWRETLTYIIASVFIMILIGYNLFAYSTNYKLQLTKKSSEQIIIRQLQTFVQRSEMMAKEIIDASPDFVNMSGEMGYNDISKDFIRMMITITPLLRKPSDSLSIRILTEAAKLTMESFHKLVADNINKSPRLLDRYIRMKKAAAIIQANPEMRISEVASMVNYESVNFFIATFYRQYQITPKQYRKKMTAWRVRE